MSKTPKANNEPKPFGRPTDFKPEYGEEILQLMASGLSLAASAAELGFHRQRVYEWVERYPDFADTIRLAQVKRQLFLERRLLTAEVGPVVTSTIFALKNAAAADWREKQEHEVSGPGGGPVQHDHEIRVVLVKPKGNSDDELCGKTSA